MLTLPSVEEPGGLNEYPVLYWNHVGLEMNRVTHSLGGPNTGPTMSSRALGLLHLAIQDAYFGALGHDQTHATYPTYLEAFPAHCARDAAWDHDDANDALTAAAITILDRLYRNGGPGISVLANETLRATLSALIADFAPHIDVLAPTYAYGECVALEILRRLAVQPGEIGADQGRYEPRQGRFYFRDEPVNPVRRTLIDPNDPSRGTRSQRIYHGPFYGTTVKTFATTADAEHVVADPPMDNAAYRAALREVARVGGAPDHPRTTRSPDQTVAALFWAYDGANLIGTPPRLYNQIIRVLAWSRRDAAASEADQTAQFVRLLALVNTAMADAGKFCWREKYRFEFWRPLSGVREQDPGSGPSATDGSTVIDADADPFWIALGAPETNTNRISFKPPFPAYPSGHATFGAACFQMTRLFYKARDGLQFEDGAADEIEFEFVSEELNGVSRDLHDAFDPSLPITEQPGIVRTRIVRKFPSLWHAIYENAISRIYLGVHWHFDAFDVTDTAAMTNPDGTIVYKDPSIITYEHVWPRPAGDTTKPMGGVPLGLGIANDIWANRMAAPTTVPAASTIQADTLVKSSNTNIR